MTLVHLFSFGKLSSLEYLWEPKVQVPSKVPLYTESSPHLEFILMKKYPEHKCCYHGWRKSPHLHMITEHDPFSWKWKVRSGQKIKHVRVVSVHDKSFGSTPSASHYTFKIEVCRTYPAEEDFSTLTKATINYQLSYLYCELMSYMLCLSPHLFSSTGQQQSSAHPPHTLFGPCWRRRRDVLSEQDKQGHRGAQVCRDRLSLLQLLPAGSHSKVLKTASQREPLGEYSSYIWHTLKQKDAQQRLSPKWEWLLVLCTAVFHLVALLMN